ncbi:AUGMIN subunit 8-like [Macadamia integrifolia]|uniref:AUGMIN subunit 8-like n=1 Tax=Macadamia integrifolia TaxID=60698 RepID=UPI001C4EF38A|nr:AUGMIN subunit 8-like [Macadamia integrifolia]XP_042505382.1 AUGMIN subunit 8-like [Macadamia integrifolia]XP_042505383.1 AUGMIN subunit 8-like [Macadamia integrifolia]XP_042505384.1 AUGMIN subunit 8-like [Macadamia integrifolia]
MGWMDVYEAKQGLRKGETEETTRPPLVPSEKNYAVTRRPKTKEVTSRYKAGITSSLSTVVTPRRCPSPSGTRPSATSPLLSKRSQSAERRRPATPPSPSKPSTPIQESSAEMQVSSRRVMTVRTPEGLWPSTMRSLSVSFQSDAFSLPITKREKTVTHISSDHTLKSSANVAHKQAETPAVRKATPERKRTPLRGRNTSDQSENSKPVDKSPARAVDQQRWPGRTGGMVSSGASTKSMDHTNKSSKASSLPFPGRGVSPLRRTPISDGLSRPVENSIISDTPKRVAYDGSGRVQFEMRSVISSSSAERASSLARSIRTQSLPIPGSPRLPSPIRASVPSSTPSRALLSPSRTRPSNPCPSVGSLTRGSSNSSSVLGFIADVRKGKKATNHIEDAHQLRLLYNRYLQWRFANARADAALSIQKITAEKTLFNVWRTTSEFWDSVTMKRINLQQLGQELKLSSILNEQMSYLEDWAVLERDHLSSLAGAVESLEACTLRIPVSGGARADVITIKDAFCSALDVMKAMGSSIYSLLSSVEGMNHLVCELASIAAQEKTVLDQCGDLLTSTAAMQMEENSLRIHLIQLQQAFA